MITIQQKLTVDIQKIKKSKLTMKKIMKSQMRRAKEEKNKGTIKHPKINYKNDNSKSIPKIIKFKCEYTKFPNRHRKVEQRRKKQDPTM